MTEALLTVTDLEVGFRTQNGLVPAVRGVSFDVYPGETVAIVGESGSGKSTTAHALINLLPGSGTVTGGQVLFQGRDLTTASRRQMEQIRGSEIGLVPQDPMNSLNPVWSIGFQVEEAIRANGLATSRRAVRKRAIEVLHEAGLSDADRRLGQFPHQFSGGMRQRVLIGIALSSHPKLLIADEPTSALDVTVQKTILDHLAKLAAERGTAVILITHDLGLAAERAENIVVMNRGRIVESGPALEILTNPQHPYTRRLIGAAPSMESVRIQTAARAKGMLTSDQVTIDGPPVIEFTNVSKEYRIRSANGFGSTPLKAVDDVSFKVHRGTTTALVGESGSGKSTLAKLLLKLEPVSSGQILVHGQDTAELSKREILELRRRMQPVFQDPYGSLDPLRNIENTVAEPLRVHKVGDAASQQRRVREVLDQVALPTSIMTRYPSELSGGQRQRVAIARAIALKPEILVLDEAVSALDVLVQGQVLDLLAELQEELGLTYLFITHDLAVVRVIADRVCVMEKGRLVEQATVDEVFSNPTTAYTRELLAAIPGRGLLLG